MEFAESKTTLGRRLEPTSPRVGGWRDLEVGPGEPRARGLPLEGELVARLVHLSDSHICDAQSPARLEYLDRFGDMHVTSDPNLYVGTYRAHEMLSVHVLGAIVAATNSVDEGRPVDAVIVTGDATDNAQRNELTWFITTLNGGVVRPDSGTWGRWEGVGSSEGVFDPSYWYPEGSSTSELGDYPRSLYGFPTVPGLLTAATTPVRMRGLRAPWLSVYGNHDALLQGTVAPAADLRQRATGTFRPHRLPEGWDYDRVAEGFEGRGPASYPPAVDEVRPVSPDSEREILSRDQWVQLHLEDGSHHGPHRDSRGVAQTRWWREVGGVLIVGLDTVNPHGGWEGSVDDEQLEWLEELLSASKTPLVVLCSHHPPQALTNDYAPEGAATRRGTKEILELISRHSAVGLWLAGHRHRHHVERWVDTNAQYDFWVIETSSTIDWPQQGRVIDIRRERDRWWFVSDVFDHAGEASPSGEMGGEMPMDSLSGWARLLALNSWQRRRGLQRSTLLSGHTHDRNVVLNWAAPR